MSRRAFTLVEVLVSLAIFAIAAVVLAAAYLTVIGGHASLTQRVQQEEDWRFVRTLVLSLAEREKLEAGGHLTLPDSRALTWRAKIEPTELPDLFRVTLEADAPPGGNVREAWHREQSLVLLRPAWSDATERDKLRADLQKQLEKGRPR